MTTGDLPPLRDAELTEAISAALVELYGRFYGHALSANQTDPGVASELFFLEAPPAVR